jgi:hypothetical protein
MTNVFSSEYYAKS